MKESILDLEAILERYPGEPRSLIALLQEVQAEFNYVSPEAMAVVCEHAGVPLTQAWSVTTFYKSFRLEPRGEHEIKVCLGTACHLKGSGRLAENISRGLNIEQGQTTTDMKFTLGTVNCLGACALAPVVILDGEYHAYMNSGKMQRLLSRLAQGEGG